MRKKRTSRRWLSQRTVSCTCWSQERTLMRCVQTLNVTVKESGTPSTLCLQPYLISVSFTLKCTHSHPSPTLTPHSPLTHSHPSLTLAPHSPLTHSRPSLTPHSLSPLIHPSLTHPSLTPHSLSPLTHPSLTHPSLTLTPHSLTPHSLTPHSLTPHSLLPLTHSHPSLTLTPHSLTPYSLAPHSHSPITHSPHSSPSQTEPGLTNIAAEAERLQPKGTSLATTEVRSAQQRVCLEHVACRVKAAW